MLFLNILVLYLTRSTCNAGKTKALIHVDNSYIFIMVDTLEFNDSLVIGKATYLF
jgi:hypothetical protein